MDYTSIDCEREKQKTKLKQKFPALTNHDFNYQPGKSYEMFHHIQIKLGKTTKELAKILVTTQ